MFLLYILSYDFLFLEIGTDIQNLSPTQILNTGSRIFHSILDTPRKTLTIHVSEICPEKKEYFKT